MRLWWIVALACAIPAQAQQAQFAPDPRIDSVFAQYDRTDAPGCVVGVYRDGNLAYARGYGMANLEHLVPLGPSSVLDVGSMGKQFTAAITVLLAQQGKLSLDDDVRKHIPEMPDYGHTITLRHLLNHTSGIRNYNGLLSFGGFRRDDVTTDDDALAIITRQKGLNFQPGNEYLYSNSGYFLLSLVAKRVTGTSLRDLGRQLIFEPLGMRRTDFMKSYDEVISGRATGYSPLDSGGFRSDMPRWLQLGDGGVWTTIEDLLLWDRNFYDPKVGGSALIDSMETPGRLATGNPTGYGLGLSVGSYRGQRTVGHDGSWGGYQSSMTRFPDHRLSVVTLCNTSTANPGQLANRVANIYLPPAPLPASRQGADRAPSSLPAVGLSASVLPLLTGKFRHQSLPELTTVADAGQLYFVVMGERYEMRHIGSYSFAILGAPAEATITFGAPGNTPAPDLRFQILGEEPMVASRADDVTVTPAELAAYAGRFFSEELQVTYEVVSSAEGLTVKARGMTPWLFGPGARDEFREGSSTLRFTRNSAGDVTGFFLDETRSRNIRFDRVQR